MMKAIILLTLVAVCISAAPAENTDRNLLMSVFDALNKTFESLPEDLFVKDLKVKGHRGCTNKFFCQTETELRMFVSGHSGANFEPFRTDKALIRNLNEFNSRHYNKTCLPDDNSEKIQLSDFLGDLKKCLQIRIRLTK